MLRLIFTLFLFLSSLWAEEELSPKLLYLSYENVPKKIYKSQIFPVTIKIIAATEAYESIDFALVGGSNVEPLPSLEGEVQKDGYNLHKTFYFKATGTHIRLPDIEVTLAEQGYAAIHKELLAGESFDAIALRPKDGFCHVIARDLNITNYKTTRYDSKSNLVVLSIEASEANIEDFKIANAFKQDIESADIAFDTANIIAYAIVPNTLKKLEFNFFNLKSNSFENRTIPIRVKDDEVSTQSDLSPTLGSYETIKLSAASGGALLFLILFLFKRKWPYLIFFLILGSYIATYFMPIKTVCVKEGTQVTLLPTKNSTVFYKISKKTELKELNHIDGYTKILLENDKVGWIKDEDICAN